MRKIVSAIDVGSDSIKFVVGEYFDNRLHILSASKILNHGIEQGKVVNDEQAINAIKKAVEEASSALGVQIEKCILGLDMANARLAKSGSAVKIKNENMLIKGEDITEVMNKCADGKVPSDFALAGVIPVEFTIDNDKVVNKPVGMRSENLGLKAIVVSLPKDYISEMLSLVNRSGLKVIDVVPNAIGDYYAFKSNIDEEAIGSIINLGYEMTSVTVFNKGLITNTTTIPLGGKNIIKDISYLAKIGDEEAYAVYQDIVLASGKLANPNEYRIVADLDGGEIRINQYDISEVAASRIDEILNLAKKQINILTKKEISYIIVTGGLTELRDFNLALQKVFGKSASIGQLKFLGARDNSYSSSIGIINYFINKLELKGKGFSIFNENELENLVNTKDNNGGNSLLGKVFGYFFDN